MNLLEMLTQKRTDPLSQFVAREKMIRRNPMKFVGDTATRLGGGDPDAGVLDLVRKREDVLGLPSLSDTEKTEIQGGFMETPEKKRADKAKRQGMIKGAITDIGSMFAGALEQEPERQLQFAPMQKQEFVPIIDPRWLPRRAKGGAVKKGQPYLVGEEGAEVVVPEEDGVVLPNPDTVDELGRQFGGNRANLVPQEEITQVETPITITEEVKEPSLADKLGAEIKAYQDPDRYKKGSQFYDKKRNWKDALRSAGYGLLQSLASAPPTNDVGALLGRAIGGAGTGAVMGATMDNVDEKMRDQFKLAKLLPQYKEAYGMERQKIADQTAEALKTAQIRNYDADNVFQTERLKQQGDIANQTALDRKRNTWHRTHKFFNPATATAAEKRQLAEFGETPESIGLYDFTKPDRKTVAGVTYAWNPNTQSFEDSGLPKDKSKTIVDYTVTDRATGVKSTYSVSSEKAASLKTQLEAAGMQIEAAKERQASQQAYQGTQNALDRDFRKEMQDSVQQYGKEQTLQKAKDAYKQLYFKTNGKNPTQAEIDAYITNTITPMMEIGFIPSP